MPSSGDRSRASVSSARSSADDAFVVPTEADQGFAAQPFGARGVAEAEATGRAASAGPASACRFARARRASTPARRPPAARARRRRRSDASPSIITMAFSAEPPLTERFDVQARHVGGLAQLHALEHRDHGLEALGGFREASVVVSNLARAPAARRARSGRGGTRAAPSTTRAPASCRWRWHRTAIWPANLARWCSPLAFSSSSSSSSTTPPKLPMTTYLVLSLPRAAPSSGKASMARLS